MHNRSALAVMHECHGNSRSDRVTGDDKIVHASKLRITPDEIDEMFIELFGGFDIADMSRLWDDL